MSNPALLLVNFLVLSILLLQCLCKRCNPDDKKVLLKIKQQFGNTTLSSLDTWDPKTDCCEDWLSVNCDDTTNRIISLTIDGAILSGQIPPSVGDLPFLQSLSFHKHPNMTGPVPPTISKLTNLEFLRITWTNVSGPVPDFLTPLKKLRILDLSFSNFSGSISPSLSQLPNLEELHLDRNKLTGSVPESFGAFVGKGPRLYLSHNQLSGKIPDSVGNTDFEDIDLSRNKLEGDASMLFGTSKTTWRIDLSRNQFQFNLSQLKISRSLAFLDLNHNKITGGIPQIWTKFNLQFLNVSYNRLCGQIPVIGSLWTSNDYTTFFHNRCLCGAPLESCK